MAQANFNINMDENLKRQFDALCADFGLNASAAINIFAETAVREKRIPVNLSLAKSNITRNNALMAFSHLRDSARENGLQDLPLAAINEEIWRVRNEREN